MPPKKTPWDKIFNEFEAKLPKNKKYINLNEWTTHQHPKIQKQWNSTTTVKREQYFIQPYCRNRKISEENWH